MYCVALYSIFQNFTRIIIKSILRYDNYMTITIRKMEYNNIENNQILKFIPSSVISFDNITKTNLILQNDSFIKYEATTIVKGELIICNDISKITRHNNKHIKETYEEYQEYQKYLDDLETINDKDKWIYNIIDGISEQDLILHRDDLCLIIPTFTWNSEDITKLHILCIPIDKNIRTIRSLNKSHITLLQHMRQVALNVIMIKYNIDETNLKMFFHYTPSTYHLHLHIMNLNHERNSSVEYSHDLDNLIFNLSLDSDYYKKISLNKRI